MGRRGRRTPGSGAAMCHDSHPGPPDASPSDGDVGAQVDLLAPAVAPLKSDTDAGRAARLRPLMARRHVESLARERTAEADADPVRSSYTPPCYPLPDPPPRGRGRRALRPSRPRLRRGIRDSLSRVFSSPSPTRRTTSPSTGASCTYPPGHLSNTVGARGEEGGCALTGLPPPPPLSYPDFTK